MATGIPPRVSTPVFHTDDLDQSGDYRTLSVLAIVSLVFGLASPLCFAAPLLMAIPVFGIAISILALRRISANSTALAGHWAATAGLILCVVFIVASVSRDLVFRSLRSHQAEEFGRSWIMKVLSGNSEEAFRLSLDGMRPPATPEPGAPAPKETPYQAYLGQPTIKTITAAGADSDVRFDGTLGFELQSSRRVNVRQRFEVMPHSTKVAANSAAQPVDVILTMQRAQLPGEGRSRWLVSGLDIETPSTHAGSSQ